MAPEIGQYALEAGRSDTVGSRLLRKMSMSSWAHNTAIQGWAFDPCAGRDRGWPRMAPIRDGESTGAPPDAPAGRQRKADVSSLSYRRLAAQGSAEGL
jgi:hypothetical protein